MEMEKIYKILEELIPNADVRTAENLIDSKLLTSLNIIRLVSALNDEFDIEITPVHLVPENFNSAASILSLVRELEEE